MRKTGGEFIDTNIVGTFRLLESVRGYLAVMQQRLGDRLTVVWRVPEQAGDQVVPPAALQTLVPVAKTEKGFVQYDLHVSNENAGEFLFYEIWDDEAALQLHSSSDFSKAFGEKYGHLIKASTLTKYTRVS